MKIAKQFDFILEKLTHFRALVTARNDFNLTDINVYAEDIYCKLFNIIFGIKLQNTNLEITNSPAIDLHDTNKRIAIQVTSDKSLTKVKSTFDKFVSNKLYEKYDRLVVYNIVEKTRHRKEKFEHGTFSFCPENDVWDHTNLINEIKKSDKIEAVYEFLFDQCSGLSIAANRAPLSYKYRVTNFKNAYLGHGSEIVPFGGRQNELKNLNSWLESACSPKNLLLTSPAGRGKSALLVQWLAQMTLEWQIAFMPISIRYETNSAKIFYESLAHQLAGILKLKLTAAQFDPLDYYKEKAIEYIQLAQESGKHILVVIDGLDEATGWQLGASLLPCNPQGHVRIVVSARLLSNKSELDWVVQLDWQAHLMKSITVPLLTIDGIKDIIASNDAQRHEIDGFASELFRITKGEPYLVKLYIDDLSQSSNPLNVMSVNDLTKMEPGFDAYFKGWMNDQKRLNEDKMFEENIKTLLCIFSCLMGPIAFGDLDKIFDKCSPNKYLDKDMFIPIERFLIGDGKSHGYVLNHQRFAIFLREEYFNNDRRIENTQLAIRQWGGETITRVTAGDIAATDVPHYLLTFYSQHLSDSNCAIAEFKALMCNGWRQAHLATEYRHLGFLNELVNVKTAVTTAFETKTVDRCHYYDILSRFTVFSSSIHSMGYNMDFELRAYALTHELLTIGQVLKQIDLLNETSKTQATIAIARFLTADQVAQLIDRIALFEDAAQQLHFHMRLAEYVGAPQLCALVAKIEGLLGEISNVSLRVKILCRLAKLVKTSKPRYLETAYRLLDNIEAPESRACCRIQIAKLRDAENFGAQLDIAINELHLMVLSDSNLIEDSLRKANVMSSAIVELGTVTPISLVDDMLKCANYVMEKTIGQRHMGFAGLAFMVARQEFIYGHFTKLALTQNATVLAEQFANYLNQLTVENIGHSDIELVRRIGQFREAISTDTVLSFANKVVKNSNRCKEVVNLLPFLADNVESQCDVTAKSLKAAENITDNYRLTTAMIAIASVVQAADQKERILIKAFELACGLPGLRQQGSAFIDIMALSKRDLQLRLFGIIKNVLLGCQANNDKLHLYVEFCQANANKLDDEGYADMKAAAFQLAGHHERYFWTLFKQLRKYLKQQDSISLWLLAANTAQHTADKVQLLDDMPAVQYDFDDYKEASMALIDVREKCECLSILAKHANCEITLQAALRIASDITVPKVKLAAYASIDNYVVAAHNAAIFENCVTILPLLPKEEEIVAATIQIIGLKGCTSTFLNQVIDNTKQLAKLKSKVDLLVAVARKLEAHERKLIEKVMEIGYQLPNMEERRKVLVLLLPLVSQQQKTVLFPILCEAYAVQPRSCWFEFISTRITDLNEIGGESLIMEMLASMEDAVEWWP